MVEIIFDKSCPAWDKDMLINQCYIKNLFSHLKNMYELSGFVYLRNICTYLGLDKETIQNYPMYLGWDKTKGHHLDITAEVIYPDCIKIICEPYDISKDSQ